MTTNTKIDSGKAAATTDAWNALWELACNFIVYGEGTIDHDGFIEYGKKQFEIKIIKSIDGKV